MKKLPYISIVIPVKNAERTLNVAIEHLINLNYPKERMEIIIVDGRSVDKTVNIIKEWQDKYECIKLIINDPPSGYAPAGLNRNIGIMAAKGEYILFTDGDCAVTREWAINIIEPFFKDPKIGAVMGGVHALRTKLESNVKSYAGQINFLNLIEDLSGEEGYMLKPKEFSPVEVAGGRECPHVATCNAAFAKKAIDDIGYFWSTRTGEDVDISLRLFKKDYKIYYTKKAIIYHIYRIYLKEFLKELYGWGHDHPKLIKKHSINLIELRLQLHSGYSIKIKGAKPALVYIGNFHLMHFALIIFFLTIFLETPQWLLVLFGAITFFFIFNFFKMCFRLKPKHKILTWCAIHYLSNLFYISGGIVGSFCFRTILVEASW